MGKLIIGILIGLVLGGALVYFLFVGAPRAAQPPGELIKPPDAGGTPPGTAEVVLKQEFFNNVLTTIFRDMNAPSFPLSLAESNFENPNAVKYGLLQEQQCESKITLLPEGSGIQTGLRFENERIAAPLAFSGGYNSPLGCFNFSGWAQAVLNLRFDAAQQTVFGVINVETVNIDGLSPVVSGLVTPLVQGTLNQRVNPIQILQGQQIALNVPIAATDGRLQATVQDVRSEVKNNALHLYVIYDFKGARTTQ
jgi:hypothetical protein